MKKFLLFSLLSIFFITAFSDDAYAQRRGKKKKKKTSKTDEYFDESGFANKLWYGGSVPFQISQFQGFSRLRIGISPMVGYRVTDIFSIGPRLSIIYNEFYFPGDNPKIMELGVGAFGRAKFTSSLFAQVEFETLNVNEITDLNTGIEGNDENFYLGVGYSSPMNGAWGYEILALFNFMEEQEDVVPIEFRAGLTYKF